MSMELYSCKIFIEKHMHTYTLTFFFFKSGHYGREKKNKSQSHTGKCVPIPPCSCLPALGQLDFYGLFH